MEETSVIYLGWVINDNRSDVPLVSVDLSNPQSGSQPVTDSNATLGSNNVAVDWGNGFNDNVNGSGLEFYSSEGQYTVRVQKAGDPTITVTFSVTIGDTLAPVQAETNTAPTWPFVSWTEGYQAQAYKVYRKTLTPYMDWVQVASFGAGIPEMGYVDTNIQPGGEYQYRVEYLSGGAWLQLFTTSIISLNTNAPPQGTTPDLIRRYEGIANPATGSCVGGSEVGR